MKNRILSLSIALLFVFCAQAQTKFGLKAGLNFPSYSYADSENIADVRTRTSFHATGYLHAPISSVFYLHPEISLQGKGGRLIESASLGGAEIIQSTRWVDFAFNFLANLPIGKLGSFFAGMGPYGGLAINGENTYANGSSSAIVIYKDNAMKSGDYGANFLAGVKVGNRLSVNANYRVGLSNIANHTFKWSDNIKNRVISLSIGVEL